MHPEISSYKRPNWINTALYCDACMYFISMPLGKLYGRKQEHDIFDALHEPCEYEEPLLERPFSPDIF